MATSTHETKLIALPVSEIILYVIRYTPWKLSSDFGIFEGKFQVFFFWQ